MSSIVQRTEKYAKTLATDLRKKGFSYSEIKKSTFVPKATLSYWLKNLNLTEAQVERLKKKRLDAARAGSAKKSFKTAQAIEEIKNSSAKAIKKISNRELWLMGIMLYWRERLLNGNENDVRKGVHFTSSDPNLVKLFLKWLKDIGRIEDEEIGFDIFVGEDRRDDVGDLVMYWAEITGFSKEDFSHVYFQKVKKRYKRKVTKKVHFGLLRTRVKASSMLARQIAGWIKGIQNVITATRIIKISKL